jgi:gliding motility-associated-like protein
MSFRIRNKHTIALLMLLTASGGGALQAQWRVSGGRYTPYLAEADAQSGLDEVAVVWGSAGLALSYTAASDEAMRLYRYTLAGSESTEVGAAQSGSVLTALNPEPGCGYWVEQGGRMIAALWLVDYASLADTELSLAVETEASNCDYTYLTLSGTIAPITYHAIDGRQHTLAREFAVGYTTLVWDEEHSAWVATDVTETKRANYNAITVDAPLCNTVFTFAGDQIRRAWGIPLSVSSSEYTAVAVDGQATAEQQVREAGNELDKSTGDLSGSAPVDVTFTAWRTAPTASYGAWEFSRYAEFDVVDATFPDDRLEYSFDDEGTTYVRYIVSNADNSCEKVVATYTVSVSESSLQVPNVFTPDDPSGSNTVFKVAYRSIVKFDARVFNRWGRQLYHWTDPAAGWDGRVGGKTVPTGAYYYIIEAEGAGGKKYKLKGDINVIRTKQ